MNYMDIIMISHHFWGGGDALAPVVEGAVRTDVSPLWGDLMSQVLKGK